LKLGDISGTKGGGGYLKDKINELESYSNKKNVGELYRGCVLIKLIVKSV
jgi:hypothetical protein